MQSQWEGGGVSDRWSGGGGPWQARLRVAWRQAGLAAHGTPCSSGCLLPPILAAGSSPQQTWAGAPRVARISGSREGQALLPLQCTWPGAPNRVARTSGRREE